MTGGRVCARQGCERSIEHLAPDANTCSNRCRQAIHRARKRPKPVQPSPEFVALFRRHEAAMSIIAKTEPDERFDLLVAVVWPLSGYERLEEAA